MSTPAHATYADIPPCPLDAVDLVIRVRTADSWWDVAVWASMSLDDAARIAAVLSGGEEGGRYTLTATVPGVGLDIHTTDPETATTGAAGFPLSMMVTIGQVLHSPGDRLAVTVTTSEGCDVDTTIEYLCPAADLGLPELTDGVPPLCVDAGPDAVDHLLDIDDALADAFTE